MSNYISTSIADQSQRFSDLIKNIDSLNARAFLDELASLYKHYPDAPVASYNNLGIEITFVSKEKYGD